MIEFMHQLFHETTDAGNPTCAVHLTFPLDILSILSLMCLKTQ